MHDTYQTEAWLRSLLTQWREVAPTPRMDVVVACEAKASWFDPATRKWNTYVLGELGLDFRAG